MKKELQQILFKLFEEKEQILWSKLLAQPVGVSNIDIFREVYGSVWQEMFSIAGSSLDTPYNDYAHALIRLATIRKADGCSNYELLKAKEALKDCRINLYEYIFDSYF